MAKLTVIDQDEHHELDKDNLLFNLFIEELKDKFYIIA